ncbi:MAG TPA: hypothetical protein VJ717_04505 [Gemmatimonadaceae bacterium]|nr:hypothetical protein [Gemmatimonadaceae bacterium]
MRHFYRSHLTPAGVVAAADEFFGSLGLTATPTGPRARMYQGVVGTPAVTAKMRLSVRPEGGHYTFVEAETDQIGESRLDRNVKRFFVVLHRREEPGHAMAAAY